MPYTNGSCLGGYEYPYNNSTQPNLDLMIGKIKALEDKVANIEQRVTALERKECKVKESRFCVYALFRGYMTVRVTLYRFRRLDYEQPHKHIIVVILHKCKQYFSM